MAAGRPKRSLGVLNDPFTDEVPGELTAWMDNMLDMFAKNVGGERCRFLMNRALLTLPHTKARIRAAHSTLGSK